MDLETRSGDELTKWISKHYLGTRLGPGSRLGRENVNEEREGLGRGSLWGLKILMTDAMDSDVDLV